MLPVPGGRLSGAAYPVPRRDATCATLRAVALHTSPCAAFLAAVLPFVPLHRNLFGFHEMFFN